MTEKNSPVDCFCRRGNEQREAIGAAAPGQSPSWRAIEASMFYRSFYFYQGSSTISFMGCFMKRKQHEKYIALNPNNLLCLLIFLLILAFSAYIVHEREFGLLIIWGLFLLVPIAAFFLSPLYYVFDETAVTIVYHFKQREVIRWSDIREIQSHGSWFFRNSGLPTYTLYYPAGEKQPFFFRGEVSKSVRTTKLIKKYYNKKID